MIDIDYLNQLDIIIIQIQHFIVHVNPLDQFMNSPVIRTELIKMVLLSRRVVVNT